MRFIVTIILSLGKLSIAFEFSDALPTAVFPACPSNAFSMSQMLANIYVSRMAGGGGIHFAGTSVFPFIWS